MTSEEAVKTMKKNWVCKRPTIETNNHIYGMGVFLFGVFVFFAVFLLAASYISVIGLENIDLNATLLLYWNPETDPFVWVLVAILGLSLLFWLVAALYHAKCTKDKK